MNKQAKVGDILWKNVTYMIILVLFIAILGFWVWNQMNGAEVWSKYYSKEFVKVINHAFLISKCCTAIIYAYGLCIG